jgi:hypothetical protein
MWRLIRRREFPGPAVINLGGRHKVACFLKAEVAAWEADNQLPQQNWPCRTRSAQAGHGEVA